MAFLSKIVPIAMFLLRFKHAGCRFGIDNIRNIRAASQFKLVVLALIANFVLMPLAAILISRMLQLDQPLGVGFILLGIAAGAPFLPKLAGVAKSNLAFAVGLTVMLMVLTVVYMPLVLPLMLKGVSVDALKIAQSLLLLMLLPLAVGLVVRTRLPRIADRAMPPLNRISGLSLILLICCC